MTIHHWHMLSAGIFILAVVVWACCEFAFGGGKPDKGGRTNMPFW